MAEAAEFPTEFSKIELGPDDSDVDDFPVERWAPLGATSPTPPPMSDQQMSEMALNQLKELEEEQEELNASLLSLTTHFAQMQFKLRQIVNASTDDKDKLLKELEEFAFKGIPDARIIRIEDNQLAGDLSEREHTERINEQREKQQQLIEQLKAQLNDIETYAYQTGTAESVPTSVALDNQRLVIDEMRAKLKVDLDNIDQMDSDQLKVVVDNAIGQIVNPGKMKEKVVEQLKTQVSDLERFIEFLQGEAKTPGPLGANYKASDPSRSSTTGTKKYPCQCQHQPCVHSSLNVDGTDGAAGGKFRLAGGDYREKINATTYHLLKGALVAVQLFVMTNLGCGSRDFKKNVLKRTVKGNHWGDLRARLEFAIDKVIQLARDYDRFHHSGDYTSDSDESEVAFCNQELTSAVRKELTPALRDLIQHGLIEVSSSSSLVPFGCFSGRRGGGRRSSLEMMHAWHVMVRFYDLKRGKEYNNTPVRKLSEAFDLSEIGGRAITSKQTLLSAIGTVIQTHTPLKRSSDSHFKALVCIALNQKRLVPWLRLILRNVGIVEAYYQPWSYVVKTGFEDAFRSLDRLSQLDFDLPVDLAVRQLHSVNDVF